MNKNAKSTTNTPSLCLPPGAVDGGHIPPFYKGPNTNAVPKYPNVDSDHVHKPKPSNYMGKNFNSYHVHKPKPSNYMGKNFSSYHVHKPKSLSNYNNIDIDDRVRNPTISGAYLL
jgi:hypothetical protein